MIFLHQDHIRSKNTELTVLNFFLEQITLLFFMWKHKNVFHVWEKAVLDASNLHFTYDLEQNLGYFTDFSPSKQCQTSSKSKQLNLDVSKQDWIHMETPEPVSNPQSDFSNLYSTCLIHLRKQRGDILKMKEFFWITVSDLKFKTRFQTC